MTDKTDIVERLLATEACCSGGYGDGDYYFTDYALGKQAAAEIAALRAERDMIYTIVMNSAPDSHDPGEWLEEMLSAAIKERRDD